MKITKNVNKTFNKNKITSQITICLSVDCTISADDLITQTIRHLMYEPLYTNQYHQLLEQYEIESYYDTSFHRDPLDIITTNQYMLKINGTLEYLLDNHRLINYRVN